MCTAGFLDGMKQSSSGFKGVHDVRRLQKLKIETIHHEECKPGSHQKKSENQQKRRYEHGIAMVKAGFCHFHCMESSDTYLFC